MILQSDITNIAILVEDILHLKFNTDKCCVLVMSRKCSLSVTPRLLFVKPNRPLKRVNSVKYLRVVLTSNLLWSEHIIHLSIRVRKLIGLLYRQFNNCHPDVMITLYKGLIRPRLEYAAYVWDPYLVKDIDVLERTQKFALKVCQRDYRFVRTSSCTNSF